MKICRRCKQAKELCAFNKNSNARDGLVNNCRTCSKIINAEWYLENKELSKENSSKYREENKDHVKEVRKRYKRNNAEREKLNNAKWYLINKSHAKKNNTRYFKHRIQNDVDFKLRSYLRRRLKTALKNNYKSGSAVRDLGCSIEELKIHLESKFQPGMTWDNHGFYGWHIDHILALKQFDLIDPEQFKKACHYTNLQPLWAEDNLSKGGS